MPDQVHVAIIGAGSFTGDLACNGCAGENIAAICDVDARVLEARHAQFPAAALYRDFRVMLAEMGDRIDAVTISTPDHTHYAAAMTAIRMGKHVFVQKPMARTIAEVRALRQAAREHHVITQMGNQGRTGDDIRTVREWVQGGVIGHVLEVHAWTDRPRPPWFVRPESVPPPVAPVPEWLDWDAWLGPAEERPFSPAYIEKRWRSWWDFGCGALGDMGCHILDTPFYALDLGPPERIEVALNEPAPEAHTAFGAVVTYHFAAREDRPAMTLTWYEGDNEVLEPPAFEENRELAPNAMYIMGERGTIMTFGAQANRPTLVPESRMQKVRDSLPGKSIPRVHCGPIEEWLRAIRGEGPLPGSNFDYAAPLTELVLLGALAIRSGQTLEWDAGNLRVTNAPEVNRFLEIQAREGWSPPC
ncbi:MAG: Gfo/Idh/MocA family oxidoreductase [Lentisphaeria bacterium]|nr:Gfo/Idh/MocA family oxidoreductase [Lentisphaeria bacterium]